MTRRRPTPTPKLIATHPFLRTSLTIALCVLLGVTTAGIALADDASEMDEAMDQVEETVDDAEAATEEMAEEVAEATEEAAEMAKSESASSSVTTLPTSEEILNGLAKAQDALLIRPLATVKVIIGAAFMVPATVFSAPSGMEGIQASYDALIDAPVEYAFRRPLGEF